MRMRNPKNMDSTLKSCDYFLNEDLFDNKNLINLEIGIGKGNFILNMALNNPSNNYIGIEKYSSVISHAIKKINSYKENGYELNNLKILVMDVKDIPSYLYNKIDTIYLNFSDPWPKKRYAKRRLTHENFLKIYDNLFNGNNKIILKTDNEDFFNFSKESLLNYGYKVIKESEDLHSDNILNSPMTEYEEKFSNKGIKIKYLEVFKEK